VPHPIDQLRLVVVDPANHLTRRDGRSAAILLFQIQRVQDSPARLPDVGLGIRVDLQHPIEPLDNLHPAGHARGLQRDVRDTVDLDPG